MIGWDKERSCFLVDGKEISFSETERDEMHTHSWYQKIPFSQTIQSPGEFNCVERGQKYFLDQLVFSGRTVLGIGCYEGFPLYLAEASGAARVVGIADDFNLRPRIDGARDFTRKKLSSTVEFIDRRFSEVSPKEIGTFDIVFVFDALHHAHDPLGLLYHAASFSTNAFFVCNQFVKSSGDSPWCAPLPCHEPEGAVRNCSAINRAWIQEAIDIVGFEQAMGKIWEIDYLSLCCVRKQPRISKRVVYDSLPDDRGMEEKTAVIMVSCGKYEEVWAPFMTLFRKYWPDCPYRFYFGTDTGSIDGVKTIAVGHDKGWAGNMLTILESIPEERFILLQEDFLLNGVVDTERVRRFVRHAHDHNAACIRLYPLPGATGEWYGTDALGTLGAFDDFRFSFQLALWSKELYASLLREGEDPWETEFVGARRAIFMKEPFLSVWSGDPLPLPYMPYAVVGGEWTDQALEFLAREGISRSSTGKKIAEVRAFEKKG